jgi:hypothetical protein
MAFITSALTFSRHIPPPAVLFEQLPMETIKSSTESSPHAKETVMKTYAQAGWATMNQ